MEQTDTTNNNRLVLLLIAGIPVTMILAASWLWYFVVEGDLEKRWGNRHLQGRSQ